MPRPTRVSTPFTVGPPPDMSTPTILPRTNRGPSSVSTSTWVSEMSRSSTASTPSIPCAMEASAPWGRKPSPLGCARTSYMFVSARLASLEANRHWVTLLSPAYIPVPMAIIRAMPATWTQRALASLSAQRSLSASTSPPAAVALPRRLPSYERSSVPGTTHRIRAAPGQAHDILASRFTGAAMKQQIALFGYPLSHSISPAFQQAALDSLSIEACYSARPTPPEGLAAEVEKLRADDHLGANVTIPHKERIRECLDRLDPWAESVGAVNTIVKEDGRLVGHNTDGYGFLRSLEERGGFSPEGKSVLLLGAGGAARAAVFALAERKAGSVLIANRTVGRGDALAADVRAHSLDAASIPMHEAGKAAGRVDLIVNATSMGMEPGPNAGLSPLDEP